MRRPRLLPLLVVGLTACAPGAPPLPGPASPDELEELYRVETLVRGLHVPWDLAWGPDGWLWITERDGGISRLDPATGTRLPAGRVAVHETREGGLMGMAFHPDFEGNPWVYAVHSYLAGEERVENRLVRMRWDGASLGEPHVLLDGIPGHKTHDGAQLAFGPEGHLHMTTGDARRPHEAQDPASLAGKVLRMTPEGKPVPGNLRGRVWTYGHRNPQGLVVDRERGLVYASEHGPSDNDEVNLLEGGGNYGWPRVRGPCDGVGDDRELCARPENREPLTAWTPTLAVAGLELYDPPGGGIWPRSLLLATLKGQALLRLTLSPDGRRVVERKVLLQGVFGRLRDVAVGPDGALYLATSNRDVNGRPRPGDDRVLRLTPRSSPPRE